MWNWLENVLVTSEMLAKITKRYVANLSDMVHKTSYGKIFIKTVQGSWR